VGKLLSAAPMPIRNAVAKHMVKSVLKEAGVEGLQEWFQGASGKAWLDWLKAPTDSRESIIDHYKRYTMDPEVLEGALVGFTLGGLMGGAGGAMDVAAGGVEEPARGPQRFPGVKFPSTAPIGASSAAVAGETAVPAMEEPAGQPAAEEGAVSTPKPERAPVELTDEDVARFAAEKPEEAARLAGIESPTRKDWKGTGLPMVGAEGRK